MARLPDQSLQELGARPLGLERLCPQSKALHPLCEDCPCTGAAWLCLFLTGSGSGPINTAPSDKDQLALPVLA